MDALVMSEPILLRAGAADTAAISLQGAELVSWRSEGTDLIWTPDPEVWSQTAPVLFPIVGWTRNGRVRVDGEVFPLGLHGFAWQKRFELERRCENGVVLVLEEDDETFALYPFAFRLEAQFHIRPGELEVVLTAINRDRRPLPYAVGLHPAICWPLAGSTATHRILFEEEERDEVPIIAPGGLFSSGVRKLPLDGTSLELTPALMNNEALCFLNAASRRFVYDSGAGVALAVELENFPHLAFWSRPPAPFLCLEAWTGHGDPEDFCGDLYEKPSMRVLAPGDGASHRAIFRLEKPAAPG